MTFIDALKVWARMMGAQALNLLAKDLLTHELDVNGRPMSSTSKAD